MPNAQCARWLVVGVARYQFGFQDLQFAERDAEELATTLRDGGFEVVLLTGSAAGRDRASKANVEGRLKSLLNGGGDEDKAIRKGDLVLVALSGHGQQIAVMEPGPDGKEVRKEVPFFCPRDAKRATTRPRRSTSATCWMTCWRRAAARTCCWWMHAVKSPTGIKARASRDATWP